MTMTATTAAATPPIRPLMDDGFLHSTDAVVWLRSPSTTRPQCLEPTRALPSGNVTAQRAPRRHGAVRYTALLRARLRWAVTFGHVEHEVGPVEQRAAC